MEVDQTLCPYFPKRVLMKKRAREHGYDLRVPGQAWWTDLSNFRIPSRKEQVPLQVELSDLESGNGKMSLPLDPA